MPDTPNLPVAVDDVVFGPKVHVAEPPPAPEVPVTRLKQTEMRPLADIQAELRQQTADRAKGKFRGRV